MKHQTLRIPPMVGFIGAQNAGKNACGEYLAATYGYVVRQFASPVYDAAWAINPWVCVSHPDTAPATFERLQDVVNRLGWDMAKRTYSDVREYLKKVGTEAGRDIHGPDCWVHIMDQRSKDARYLAICDVRFENEVNFIRDHGGIIIWVRRPGKEQNASDTHISEQLCRAKYSDYELWNESSLDRLHARIEEILDRYEGHPQTIPFQSDV